MSNVFRDIYNFVPVIQRWQPGLRLSHSLINFHDCLCYLAFSFSAVRFENIPNSLFADLRQMSPDAVMRGREEARELKWIGCERGYRNTYRYWFLDAGGQEFIPKPEAKAKAYWRYQADRWQMHLAKRRIPREKPEANTSSTSGNRREFDRPSSGNARGSQPELREGPKDNSPQTVENSSLEPNCWPLEYLKPSEKIRSSEDLDFHSEASSETECISPPWGELGSLRSIKGAACEKDAAGSRGKGKGLLSKEVRILTRERTKDELFAHIQTDRGAIAVVTALRKKFGAKIVEVRDTRIACKRTS